MLTGTDTITVYVAYCKVTECLAQELAFLECDAYSLTGLKREAQHPSGYVKFTFKKPHQ